MFLLLRWRIARTSAYSLACLLVQEQFLSLLDAENCFIIFEAKRSVLEFDGRTICPSARAKKGLLQKSLRSGQPLHLSSPTSCENAQIIEGISNIDIRVRPSNVIQLM